MELVTAEKKDSQGLCFIGVYEFLKKYSQKKGQLSKLIKRFYMLKSKRDYLPKNYCHLRRKNSIHPDMGKVVGKHQGAHYLWWST
jgi:tRNA-specific 2-thiouridylase